MNFLKRIARKSEVFHADVTKKGAIAKNLASRRESGWQELFRVHNLKRKPPKVTNLDPSRIGKNFGL